MKVKIQVDNIYCPPPSRCDGEKHPATSSSQSLHLCLFLFPVCLPLCWGLNPGPASVCLCVPSPNSRNSTQCPVCTGQALYSLPKCFTYPQPHQLFVVACEYTECKYSFKASTFKKKLSNVFPCEL